MQLALFSRRVPQPYDITQGAVQKEARFLFMPYEAGSSSGLGQNQLVGNRTKIRIELGRTLISV